MMDTNNILEGAKLIQQGMDKLARGPLSFYLQELVGANDLCIQRFSPFHVGDVVRLVKKLNLRKESGWYSCRHFLVPGAIAEVKVVELGSKGFSFYVWFDEESFIGMDGRTYPIKDKHQFHFGEGYFELADEVRAIP